MKKIRSGSKGNIPKGIAAGMIATLFISITGAMLLAALISSERVGEASIGIGCFTILAVSVFLGSLLSSRIIGEKHLIICGISAASCYLVLLVLALAFGDGFAGIGVNGLAVLLGGGAAALLGLAWNKSGARRHKFRNFR